MSSGCSTQTCSVTVCMSMCVCVVCVCVCVWHVCALTLWWTAAAASYHHVHSLKFCNYTLSSKCSGAGEHSACSAVNNTTIFIHHSYIYFDDRQIVQVFLINLIVFVNIHPFLHFSSATHSKRKHPGKVKNSYPGRNNGIILHITLQSVSYEMI